MEVEAPSLVLKTSEYVCRVHTCQSRFLAVGDVSEMCPPPLPPPRTGVALPLQRAARQGAANARSPNTALSLSSLGRLCARVPSAWMISAVVLACASECVGQAGVDMRRVGEMPAGAARPDGLASPARALHSVRLRRTPQALHSVFLPAASLRHIGVCVAPQREHACNPSSPAVSDAAQGGHSGGAPAPSVFLCEECCAWGHYPAAHGHGLPAEHACIKCVISASERAGRCGMPQYWQVKCISAYVYAGNGLLGLPEMECIHKQLHAAALQCRAEKGTRMPQQRGRNRGRRDERTRACGALSRSECQGLSPELTSDTEAHSSAPWRPSEASVCPAPAPE